MTPASPASLSPEPLEPVTPPEGAKPVEAPAGGWSSAQRVGFRLVCAYLVLYILPFPLDRLPGGETLTTPYEALWDALVPWVGKHLMPPELSVRVLHSGSGDTPYAYTKLFLFVVLAGVAAAVWSWVDRHRTQYVKAHDVLRTLVRYLLAMAMLGYGMSKVLWLQFGFPEPEQLLHPYGESSPMGLLWTFMGYSEGYNLFAGGAEVLGGVLLFFRRTTTLGALVLVGVMTNVVALNFFYDVPVKLYSSHLLLMAVFLVVPDARRLVGLLVLNRPTQPRALQRPFALSRRMEWGLRGVKVLCVGWMVYGVVDARLEARRKWGADAPRPALHGLYQVESFTRDGQTLPPLLGDSTRWRTLTVNRFNRVTLWRMDDTVERFNLEDDPEKKTVTLSPVAGFPGLPPVDGPPRVLGYARPDPQHLVLQGTLEGSVVEVRLKRVDLSKFPLVHRGFHWIQEYPFNR
jgi:uncharacterized membrane protein YphA (DoxX/SURF4 family)